MRSRLRLAVHLLRIQYRKAIEAVAERQFTVSLSDLMPGYYTAILKDGGQINFARFTKTQ